MGITINLQYDGKLRSSSTHVKSGTLLQTDAPTDNQGLGTTFSPTDLTATSLVSCMITVMGIKAQAANILFSNVKATCTKVMTSNPRRISELIIEIVIDHNWTLNQKEIMQTTALDCPVALSLHPSIKQTVTFTYA